MLPIRVRFFREFQRDHMKIPSVDVAPGNEAANHGALKTDLRVFELAAAELHDDDYRAFELIYGLSVENARKYLGMCPTPKTLMFLIVCYLS